MYNKKFKKFLKKTQPNSGFTLTELLTGLFMSVFVTGALGFGLYQIMSATAREKAKTDVRNEASRAVEFISDELRRAQSIEPNANNATGFNDSGKKVVLALNIPELNNSDTLDSDDDADTSERVVYYLKSTDLDNWQGPQVLYRWGPPLDGNGNYTENDWQYEALIDGIDDTPISAVPDSCVDAGDNITPTMSNNPSGFYACLNGTNTAAQIFLTGGIDTDNIAGNDSNYTAQTQAVARAKNVTVNNAQAAAGNPITFKSLEADYVCNPGDDLDNTNDDVIWTMRTDFDNSAYASGADNAYDRNTDSDQGATINDATKWVHEPGRQAQPINISSSNDLTIYSIPIESNGCLNATSGNEGRQRTEDLSDFVVPNNEGETAPGYTVPHTIQFQKTVANRPGDDTNPNFWQTFNGNTTNNPEDTDNYNNPNVDASGKVQVFKNGSTLVPGATIILGEGTNPNVPAPLYSGYDFDDDGNPDRISLGRFLLNKGYAELVNSGESSYINDPNNPFTDPPSGYRIKGLEDNDRIIAFEIGQDDNGFGTYDTDENGEPHPGFDMQDNVFIMSHDVFEDNHTSDENESSGNN